MCIRDRVETVPTGSLSLDIALGVGGVPKGRIIEIYGPEDVYKRQTQIHVLKEHDSIRELARLLGGAEITPAVLENAKEMKELAQKQKNTRFK